MSGYAAASMGVPMRFSTFTLLLLAVTAGCKGKPPAADTAKAVVDAGAAEPTTAAPPENSWTAFDADHAAFVEQKGVDATRCKVTCTLKNDTVAWTLDKCIGTKDDLRFVARDCGSVAVLYTYPEIEESWPQTTVMRAFSRGGLVRELKAVQMVRDGDELKMTKSRFRWLKGVLGEVGTPPHYSEDGKNIEFDTVDDAHKVLALPAIPAAPAAPEGVTAQ